MASQSIWAVVPVKPFGRAKRRLDAVLSHDERAQLARVMLEDVLEVLAACKILTGVAAITSDRAAAEIARSYGAVVLHDPGAGINAAVRTGRAFALGRENAGVIVVPSDIPLLTTSLIAQIADHVARPPAVALVPATRDGGTNLLACSPADAIDPEFGPDSSARHVAGARKAGIAPTVLASQDVGLDIDRPEDLLAFLSAPSATRSHVYLATLGIEESLRRVTAELVQGSAAYSECFLSPMGRRTG
jgi:2-phospho-L-lactate guanylyltransferase